MDEAGNSTRNWATLRFNGDVDRRRIKREVRKWAKRALDRTLHCGELQMLMKGRVQAL